MKINKPPVLARLESDGTLVRMEVSAAAAENRTAVHKQKKILNCQVIQKHKQKLL